MSMSASRWMLALACATAAAGFLLPLWPLGLVGVAIAVLSGSTFSPVFIALLLDIAYGTPVGSLHALYFPFTIFALACIAARYVSSAYVRKGSNNTL